MPIAANGRRHAAKSTERDVDPRNAGGEEAQSEREAESAGAARRCRRAATARTGPASVSAGKAETLRKARSRKRWRRRAASAASRSDGTAGIKLRPARVLRPESGVSFSTCSGVDAAAVGADDLEAEVADGRRFAALRQPPECLTAPDRPRCRTPRSLEIARRACSLKSAISVCALTR